MNWLLPLGLMFLLWGWLARRFTGGGGGILSLGKNRVHIHPDSLPKVTFNDVAGAEDAKQELKETIEFLQDPRRIQRLGGRMPKGVLLVGTARHRKDAVGPCGIRRSRCSLFQH